MLEKQASSRYRIGAKTPFTKEYYLRGKGRRGWFTMQEMIDFDECEIEGEALRHRIFKTKQVYKNLWDAITFKNRSKTKSVYSGSFEDLMILLPVGSLHKNALIMQSKNITKGNEK